MRRRLVGRIGLTTAMVLVVAGLVLLGLVIPGMAQFPDDVDTDRVYEGELTLMLNSEALASMDLANVFLRDVPITIDRNVQTLEVDGEKALVSDTAVMSSPAGPIQSSEDIYTIDRKSMEHVANFTSDARVIERDGLVVGFPIGTEPADYVGWNGDTLEANTVQFVQEIEHEGLTTFEFNAASGPEPIQDPVVLAALPAELPKAVIEGLVPALGLPEDMLGQLGQLLPSLPDPVPLEYLYTYETNYWVEPDSGVLVDYAKMETRTVGLNLGDQLIPLTDVMQLEYEQTAASVAEAVADAEDASSRLFWFGSVLPYGLIAAGLLVALLSVFALRRPAVEPAQSEPRELTRV